MWRRFAERVAEADTYAKLGLLLVSTYEVILGAYIRPGWRSGGRCGEWQRECAQAQSAAALCQLIKELESNVLWDEVEKLWVLKKEPEQGQGQEQEQEKEEKQEEEEGENKGQEGGSEVEASDWATWKQPCLSARAMWACPEPPGGHLAGLRSLKSLVQDPQTASVHGGRRQRAACGGNPGNRCRAEKVRRGGGPCMLPPGDRSDFCHKHRKAATHKRKRAESEGGGNVGEEERKEVVKEEVGEEGGGGGKGDLEGGGVDNRCDVREARAGAGARAAEGAVQQAAACSAQRLEAEAEEENEGKESDDEVGRWLKNQRLNKEAREDRDDREDRVAL
eukprot:jgi/Mesen1/8072/ME000433S07365